VFDRVLVVCVGNVCRSPMAAGLLRARLGGRAGAPVIDSAGVAALVGAAPDPLAVKLLREREIDISGHRAVQLSYQVLRRAPLILAMEAVQQRWIVDQWPEAQGRVQLLGRWGRFEVPDPLGGTEQEFRDCLGLIEVGVAEWCERVAQSGLPSREDR